MKSSFLTSMVAVFCIVKTLAQTTAVLSSGTNLLTLSPSATPAQGVFDFNAGAYPSPGNIHTFQGTSNASSGTTNWLSIEPTINQTGAAGYTTLLISPYQSQTGSGSNYLINAGTCSAASGGGTFTQLFSLSYGGQTYFRGRLSSGTTSMSGQFNLGSTIAQNAWGTTGVMMNVAASTFTDNSSSGTVANNMVNSFGVPSLAAMSTTTYTNAANVYIAGAPTPAPGGNVTITNPSSLYVASGNSAFLGGISTGNVPTTSNFFSVGGQSFGNTGQGGAQFAGSTVANFRVLLNGLGGTTINTNTSVANLILASTPVTTPGTGTNPLIANEVINPIGNVTPGGATVAATASLYINGAGSGGASNYTQWNSSGTTRLNTGMVMNRTAVSDAAYTVLGSDYIVAYTSLSAARTVTLPSSGITAGQEYIIKDESGNAGADNITVAGTIDGAANKVISANYGVVKVYYNGSAWFTW